MINEIRTHTALHVLKGAVQKILGAELTTGVYQNENRGRLTVQFDRKPTEKELAMIEEEANKKISEDAVVEELEMDRSAAEDRWGEAIYDSFPLPTTITKLKILHIQDWNVNACNKAHTKTTGEIGGLEIRKTRYRYSKKNLEISFEINNS